MRALGVAWGFVFFAGCLAEPSEVWLDPPIPPGAIVAGSSELQLLPFSVRMNKLSLILELPLEDPLFDTLQEQRLALGDHDYARQVRPDRRWSARKIGIWIKSLLPICTSARFAELYPEVATDPSKLILRAYGRPADDIDTTALAEIRATAAGDLDPDTTVCLAVLSSLELVAQ